MRKVLFGAALCGASAFAGTLDQAVIEGTIEKHFDEVTTCYEEGLGRNAELAGTVTVRFAIGAKGEVPAAEIRESTLKDKAVEECITKAVKTWTFAKPKGKGLVWAIYPFVLKSK